MRQVEDRKNETVLITGLQGSGKSRMGKELARDWDRKIYFDPARCFLVEDEEHPLKSTQYIVTSHDDFVIKLAEVFNNDEWEIALQFPEDDDYDLAFATLWKIVKSEEYQQKGESFLIIFDEIDNWSDPKWIEPNLRKLIKRARHYGVSWIAICQFETDTNKTFRGNATEKIIFLQGMLSADMAREVKGACKIRGQPEFEVQGLRVHDTKGAAVEGTHFFACPIPFDEWRDAKWRARAEAA